MMKYKSQGRVIPTDRGLMLLSSADSIEFRAVCSGRVAINIFAETTKGSGETDCYFTGFVDSVRCNERFHVTESTKEIVLCNEIPKGEHCFKLVRQNEWGHGDIYVTGISLEGEFLDAPNDNELFIEFIGDSLTTGFGNLPDAESDITWAGAPIYQDATLAFPYMTGEELSADISVVAIQGIGTACGGWEFTMNDIYECYPRVNEKDYRYEPNRTADIVVILIIGNDKDNYRELGLTIDDVFDKAAELCRMARAKHPHAKVIFSPADYIDEGKRMVEEKLGGAENGYYSVVLPMDSNGKGGHPSVDGHIIAKNILVPMIRELTERK